MSSCRKPLIYLAGPYRQPDPAKNTHRAIVVARLIEQNCGVVVFVPHVSWLENLVTPRDEEFWLSRDLEFLQHCDALYRLKGESHGADMEVCMARQWNIPVFRYESEIHDWRKAGCPPAA